jgi:hypothetical protein
MIPLGPILIAGLHNLAHGLAHTWPHLVHFGREKAGPKYYELKDDLKDKLKERRRAQQEQSMGEPRLTFLSKEQEKIAKIEKAAEELEKT